MRNKTFYFFIIFILFSGIPEYSYSQKNSERKKKTFRVWKGSDSKMKISDLAAYCAPVFWFSPDEPELHNKTGKDIRIPAPFPFENKCDSPVVYYQVTDLLTVDDPKATPFVKDFADFGNSVLNLKDITAIYICYTHFYNYESGLGSHKYDTEQAQFQFLVNRSKDSLGADNFAIYFIRVTAKAHALAWYDNIYEIDTDNPDYEISLPFNISVEEGKHASCTDMNADGYYTPGYDVNVRINDAWGLRDVIRSGNLFSSAFQSYMAKIRTPPFRVLPPLPDDSPLKSKYIVDGVYSPDNAVYQLRPMPSPDKAYNHLLKKDMTSYYYGEKIDITTESSEDSFINWFTDENAINSFAFAYRSDESAGAVVSFPLLIFKNVEAPLVGGWLVNRIYYQDYELGLIGYNILYTPSASRFLDPYFSVGADFTKYRQDSVTTYVQTDFAFETGIKIRANLSYSPLKFLSFISPFWGVRLGIKNKGFMSIDHLNYIIEFGAGVW